MRYRLLLGLALLTAALAQPSLARAGPPSTEAWYVMDREGWLRTDDERLVLTTYDLSNGPQLANLPYQLGDWVGIDLPVQNLETYPTLDAEHLVYRGYVRSDGAMLVLSIIGSSKGQSFHHPLVCYEWASWPAEDRGTVSLALERGDVVLRYVVGIDPQGPRQVDLHWYLWPDARRVWEDGATQVRVTALATDGDAAALAAARDFARLLFAEARRPEAAPPPAGEAAPPAPTETEATPPVPEAEAAPGAPEAEAVPPVEGDGTPAGD
jgi:hypothetical protein